MINNGSDFQVRITYQNRKPTFLPREITISMQFPKIKSINIQSILALV